MFLTAMSLRGETLGYGEGLDPPAPRPHQPAPPAPQKRVCEGLPKNGSAKGSPASAFHVVLLPKSAPAPRCPPHLCTQLMASRYARALLICSA